MNIDGGGASGTGGTELTSFFDGGALAEWGTVTNLVMVG